MHLYLHVPFCARRCSYCDFAIAVRTKTPSEAYVEAVLAEWEAWQSCPAWRLSDTVRTIYFGGGTPSRLTPDALDRVLHRIRQGRPVDLGAELTLEANPDDVTADRASAWARSGINRVSLGAQSFDPDVLRWMHRTHGPEQIQCAVRVLRHAGFANVSLDLIYGLPTVLHRDWRADLDQAVALEPEHLSLYGLTVEPHTALAKWTLRGEVAPADDGAAAEEYLLAHRLLAGGGFEHYEVSNFARPGCRSRHNAAYWARAPFLGLGPSAHSGYGTVRSWNFREWESYRRRISAGQTTTESQEELGPAQVRLEELYLGLRTLEGVATPQVPATEAELWTHEGWAAPCGGRLRLRPEGWLRLDSLVARLTDS